ncbi:MAG: AAA family ATPase [Actinomycetota bacterium]|nr:AAA family ATPase [Actinomycetota bacterium]
MALRALEQNDIRDPNAERLLVGSHFSMGGIGDGGSFVGRQSELEVLRAMLSQAAGSARFVLLTGERGMGKTSLLRTFLAGAGAVCRVTASGDECERVLPYGVLEQLARSADPVLPFKLPVLTSRPSPPADPVAMQMALLELLRALEQRAPVVLIVDDVHVADEPSLTAMLFAFRRLAAARVLAVLSAPEEGCVSLPEGLRRLIRSEAGATVRLEAFDDRLFRELVSPLGIGPLSPTVGKRLHQHSGGNPHYARMLIEELGVDALHRLGELPWPAPKSHARDVLDSLAGCPPAARRLVAAAAVLGMRCPLAVVQHVAGVEQPLDALQAAIDRDLLTYDNREVAFSSALVRGAVYHGLALSDRADLHARAATAVVDEPAVLRHRVAATTGFDEGLASAVEAFAGREAARGDWAGAAALFEEAAVLFPPGRSRERSVFEAVECHLLAGDILTATAVGRDLESWSDVARSHYLLGCLAAVDARYEEAGRLLTRALDSCQDDVDPALESKIAIELASLNAQLLQPTGAIRWAERAIETAQGMPVAQRALPYLAFGLGASGHAELALQLVRSSPVPRADRPGPELASHLMAGSVALVYDGELDRARDQAGHLVTMARRSGLAKAQVEGLALLSFIEYRLGAWTDAIDHAEAGISLSECAGLASSESLVHAMAAWPRAGRGEWTAAEAHVSRALGVARCPSDIALARMADAAVARARQQHQRVVDAVTALRALGAPGAVDEPGGLWPWHEVYVDALIALGLLDDAGHEVLRISAVATRRAPCVMATALRLRASLEMARGAESEADESFRNAVSQARGVSDPFNRALVHASYGAFLRRCGQRTAAAAELGTASALFAHLGARPFLERCDRELASTRRPAGRRPNVPSNELTAREASVARLVCEGKRNREVATELVVSENTVEYHLKHIYAKLGIASRSQLIVRLGPRPETSVGERDAALMPDTAPASNGHQ